MPRKGESSPLNIHFTSTEYALNMHLKKGWLPIGKFGFVGQDSKSRTHGWPVRNWNYQCTRGSPTFRCIYLSLLFLIFSRICRNSSPIIYLTYVRELQIPIFCIRNILFCHFITLLPQTSTWILLLQPSGPLCIGTSVYLKPQLSSMTHGVSHKMPSNYESGQIQLAPFGASWFSVYSIHRLLICQPDRILLLQSIRLHWFPRY